MTSKMCATTALFSGVDARRRTRCAPWGSQGSAWEPAARCRGRHSTARPHRPCSRGSPPPRSCRTDNRVFIVPSAPFTEIDSGRNGNGNPPRPDASQSSPLSTSSRGAQLIQDLVLVAQTGVARSSCSITGSFGSCHQPSHLEHQIVHRRERVVDLAHLGAAAHGAVGLAAALAAADGRDGLDDVARLDAAWRPRPCRRPPAA